MLSQASKSRTDEVERILDQLGTRPVVGAAVSVYRRGVPVDLVNGVPSYWSERVITGRLTNVSIPMYISDSSEHLHQSDRPYELERPSYCLP